MLSQLFPFLAQAIVLSSLGGPDSNEQLLSSRQSFLNPQLLAFNDETTDFLSNENLLITNGSSLLSVLSPGPLPKDEIVYEVKAGDTLSGIAKEFNISVNTIIWANNLKSAVIKPGDELVILPVSGVRHVVAAGDTVEKIAAKYKANIEVIIAFNALTEPENLQIDDILIVPDGVKASVLSQNMPPRPKTPVSAPLTDTRGYFIFPTTRSSYNQGQWHRYNAVDISNSACYEENIPIYAAADGMVLAAFTKGWNGGYGRYIKIEHPNGLVTLYAHNKKILVDEEDEVTKGQLIAYMGSTGHSTGCHVHFEVRGGRNPFVR
ncbi:MAG: M23 family metallopeptidase [Parcubacteria group bacterium]|nr:M23 family metallopeptidase [Parcubacteria group bacterium]